MFAPAIILPFLEWKEAEVLVNSPVVLAHTIIIITILELIYGRAIVHFTLLKLLISYLIAHRKPIDQVEL